VVEDRAHAALARRPRVRRQGRRVRALHGPAVAHPRDARGGTLRRGAARAHRRRGLASARRARRVGHHGRLPRLPPRLAWRVLDREERVRGAAQRVVLDSHGGLPGVREAGGRAGDRLVRPRAARAGAPRLHHRRGGGRRAGGHPRRLRPRLPARARGRRGALPRRGRVRAPPRRRGALMARIVLAGYLVRNPLGGYAWQAAHYLLGLRALGHEAWFYEDTGHYAAAYNPRTNEFGEAYGYGIAATADFLARLGLGERWVFVDTVHGEEHGPGAGRAAALVREADLLINLAGVNRIPPEQRAGRPSVYRVVDPLAVSADPWRYRDYLRGSRGEFTVAKDVNVRLRSGWFSDRAACYLAAGRPVVEQDTGFGDVLPLGPGLRVFRSVEEAAAGVRA